MSDAVRDLLRWIINPWVVLGAVIIALVLSGMTFALLMLTRPGPSLDTPATAVMNVIPAPTATATRPVPTRAPSPTPTSLIPPSPPPGVINLGATVQIHGTGGDGLRLRETPGLNGKVKLLGAEDEVFQARDGPREVDGYTWWYLVGLYDETRKGWAVSNYLAIVQNP